MCHARHQQVRKLGERRTVRLWSYRTTLPRTSLSLILAVVYPVFYIAAITLIHDPTWLILHLAYFFITLTIASSDLLLPVWDKMLFSQWGEFEIRDRTKPQSLLMYVRIRRRLWAASAANMITQSFLSGRRRWNDFDKNALSRTLGLLGIESAFGCTAILVFVVMRPWIKRHGWGTLILTIDFLKGVVVATGYLEPPLKPGMTRVRGQCRCGHLPYVDILSSTTTYVNGKPRSDFNEIIEMSGLDLIDGYRRNGTAYFGGSRQSLIRPQPRLWLQRVVSKLQSTLGLLPKQSPLPQHSANTNTSVTVSSQGTATQHPKLLRLLTCMRSARFGKSLHQGCVDNIKTDRQLFDFLRDIYKFKRGQPRILLSLKVINGIHFVRLNLFAGGTVEVRHHNACCKHNCTCIPPASLVEPSNKAEYQCKPAGPLQPGPPILPEVLAHFYSSPTCISERASSVLTRLPKRVCGELQEPLDEPAEGWGIYFQEGWDSDIITFLVFVMFLSGSLLFGILWSCLKMDVQGAFGVSAYVLTAGAMLLSLAIMRANKA